MRRPPNLLVVLTPAEVQVLLAALAGTYRLMAHALYRSGLRLADGLP